MNQHQYAPRRSQRPTNKSIQLHGLESRTLVKILFHTDLFSNSCLVKSHPDTQGHSISRCWRGSKSGSGTDTWPLCAGRAHAPTLSGTLTFQPQPRADPSASCTTTTTTKPGMEPTGAHAAREDFVSTLKGSPLGSEGTCSSSTAGLC